MATAAFHILHDQPRPRIDTGRLKASVKLSDVVRQDVALRRVGAELVGLCPFHAEKTASFNVNDAKGVFHCFGCGASGDVIAFVRRMRGCDFLEAVQLIGGSDLPRLVSDGAPPVRDDATEQQQARELAREQWRDASGIEDTPAETYLRGRGIAGDLPRSLRFGHPPLWTNLRNGSSGQRVPALIAACQDRDGRLTGIQRVFLTEDGRRAPFRNPKLSLGRIRGGAVRLGPVAPEIVICEGVEDGLTIRDSFPDHSVWVAVGSSNLSRIEFPDEVRHVIVAGDGDEAGRRACEAARAAYRGQGRKVSVYYPRMPFSDWNEQAVAMRTTKPYRR